MCIVMVCENKFIRLNSVSCFDVVGSGQDLAYRVRFSTGAQRVFFESEYHLHKVTE